MLNAQVKAVADSQLRTHLKTIRDEGVGFSSGLIPCGSRASAEDESRPQLQVTDRADLPRTHVHRLGKRVGAVGSPSTAWARGALIDT
jgi:hypothetical protein